MLLGCGNEGGNATDAGPDARCPAPPDAVGICCDGGLPEAGHYCDARRCQTNCGDAGTCQPGQLCRRFYPDGSILLEDYREECVVSPEGCSLTDCTVIFCNEYPCSCAAVLCSNPSTSIPVAFASGAVVHCQPNRNIYR